MSSAPMIRPEFRKELTESRGAAVILWCFFMISIPLYIIIVRNVLANPKYAAGLWFAESARIILWLLVAVDLGYLWWWKRRYLTGDAILQGAGAAKILRALENHQGMLEQRAAAVVSAYVTRKTVVFAIIEAIAVYGLLLALAGRYLADYYLLSALSLLLLAVEFPRAKQIEALIRRVEDPSDCSTCPAG